MLKGEGDCEVLQCLNQSLQVCNGTLLAWLPAVVKSKSSSYSSHLVKGHGVPATRVFGEHKTVSEQEALI
jgi:hypothetical protein